RARACHATGRPANPASRRAAAPALWGRRWCGEGFSTSIAQLWPDRTSVPTPCAHRRQGTSPRFPRSAHDLHQPVADGRWRLAATVGTGAKDRATRGQEIPLDIRSGLSRLTRSLEGPWVMAPLSFRRELSRCQAAPAFSLTRNQKLGGPF